MPMGLGGLGDRGITRSLQTRLSVEPGLSLSLMPELAPVINIGDAPELLFHQGWKRWSAGVQTAALAANAGRIRIRNPGGSNMLCVVESVSMTTLGAASEFTAFLFAYNAGVDLTTVNGNLSSARDGRMNPSVGASMVISSDRIGAIPTANSAFVIVGLTNTTVYAPNMPLILVPGNAWDFGAVLVNVAIDFTIVWRERMLQEQENSL